MSQSESAQKRALSVSRAVAGWQRDLVELGGRNTLLWFRDLSRGTLDLTNAHPGGLAMLLAGRPTKLSDLFREATVLQEALRRARAVRDKAVELADERGIVAGCLAVGMASWDVPGASRSPASPVLLRRCVLRPRGVAMEDFEVDLAPQVDLNPVLEHYLRSIHGIALDAAALAAMATVRGTFNAQPVFAALTDACAQLPGFAVSRRLVVATFSTAKLPMVADLPTQTDRLVDHDMVAALAGDPSALAGLRVALPPGEPDGDPRGEHLVLDADFAQQEVIRAVTAGASLVVDGPPGTGKTQTIANLVAALAAEGKRVLLVAQKRPALDGVLGRLESVGLGGLVLDVHDALADRSRISAQIRAVLDGPDDSSPAEPAITEEGDPASMETLVDVLVDRRRALREHAGALHERREPWEVSAYDALIALSRLSQPADGPAPGSPVRVGGDPLRRLTPRRREELRSVLHDVAAKGAWPLTAPPEPDPWFGAYIASPSDAATAHEIVARLSSGALTAARRLMGDALHDTGLPTGRSVGDWGRLLELLTAVRQTLEVFRPEVFDVPLTDLSAAVATRVYRHTHEVTMAAWTRRRLRGQVRQLLRPGPAPADLHDRLIAAQDQRIAWEGLAGAAARPQVPADLDAVVEMHAGLGADLGWLAERLRGTGEGSDLSAMPLDELQARLVTLAARRDRLDVVPLVVEQLAELSEAGLGPLVEDLAARRVPPDRLDAELDLVWWASLLDEVERLDPRYGAHDGDRMLQVRDEYVAADRSHLSATAKRVRTAVAQRFRRVLSCSPDAALLLADEPGQLQRQRPLRELFPPAGELLTAAKPCWAMSPLVVASVLPPGRWFDVVIFDEASQIGVAESVAAVSRADQVVVVGDRAQLPPMPFSTSAPEGSAPREAPTARESVLDALYTVLPVCRLTTHYRSLDERLVSLANTHMYAGSLLTYPGTGDLDVMDLVVVDGVAPVEAGVESIETTPAEVQRVVDLALEHARTRPQESLGVVTLTSRHAEAISEALRIRLSQQPPGSEFFAEDRTDRFFVADVERVQGDVRDAVVFSVGYGRTPHGRVLHAFGVLDAEGGQRRLNVATTRARVRMTVVSSLRSEDLAPGRLRSPGAVMLRDLLAFASTSSLRPADGAASSEAPVAGLGEAAGEGLSSADRGPVAAAPEPLLADLARRLRAAGLRVRENVGASAYPLDLAVDDPERPGRGVLAIETDGPRYAAVAQTRERDRLRQEQLERLGWMYARVWSADLFRDPVHQVEMVAAALGHELRAGSPSASPSGPGRPSGAAPDEEPEADSTGSFARSGAARSSAAEPVLDQTRDDTDLGWGERRDVGDHERWLREQRPPHWE